MNSKISRKPAIPKAKKPLTLPIGVPADYSLEKDGVTQTLLGDFLTCRRRWLLKLHRYVDPKKQRTKFFGTMVHAVLGEAYEQATKTKKGFTPQQVKAVLEKCVPRDIALIPEQELAEDRAKAAGVLDAYFWYYAKEFKGVFKPERVYDTKLSFGKEVVFNMRIRGRIDITSVVANMVRLWEHKTKSRIDEESLLLQLSFDLQTLFYTMLYHAQEKIMPEELVYNVIRKPSIKAYSSLQELYTKCYNAAKSDPEHYFKRWVISLGKSSEKMLAAFKEEIKVITRDMSTAILCPENCYPNSKACTSPFRCEYLEACSSGSMSGYVQKELLFEELEGDE